MIIYPVLFIDAIHYSVRDNGIIKKLAAYVILGINLEGRKEVLTIEVGQNESSKYWLAVLNNLKNRGVRDIMIICADGLTGIKEEVENKWSEKYPNAMKSWRTNWDAITPIFKFSADVRTIIYTTNAIESLNSTYRKLNRQRSVFPSDQALLKALYLATFEATKKWTMPIRNWGKAYGELSIMYEGRMPE